MKKATLKSILLVLTFILLRTSVPAQPPYCPMYIFNTADKIGLINPDLYASFVPNTYYVTFVSSNPSNPTQPCFLVDMPVSVTKVAAMNTVIPGATAGAGIVFNFPPSPCEGGAALPTNLENTALQSGSTSIIVTTAPLASPFLLVNYTENTIDDCIYIVIPVTFGPFTVNMASGPTRALLEWTTYSESDINHYTIEKSSDAVNWHKIGQVASAGNSSTTTNYSFSDNSPNNIAYYRIVSVDIDCRRHYTPVRRLDCSYCSSTFSWPTVTPDCNPPAPVISGASSICNNGRTVYRLNGLKGDAQVTWSISPSYFATLSQASRLVGLTPAGISGNATLTATVVKNGVTSYYNKPIVFGIPPLYVFGVNYSPGNWSPTVEHTATVNMLPGTNPWDYSWYQNGGFIGNGDQHVWTILQGQVIYYNVRYNGPCGQSIAYGSSEDPFRPAPCVTYTVSPNPARTVISIAKTRCASEPRKSTMDDNVVVVKIYDMQGVLRKTAKASTVSSKIDISAAGLLPGLYYIQISEAGEKEVKLKLLIE